jgi:hypothetical protein
VFAVTIDPEVLAGLAARLEVWGFELTNAEWEHLVGLLGLGSTILAEVVAGVEENVAGATEAEAMGSPGFADALSPAADAVLSRAGAGLSVVISFGPGPSQWTVTSARPESGPGAPQ